jgi:hypothetical protein
MHQVGEGTPGRETAPPSSRGARQIAVLARVEAQRWELTRLLWDKMRRAFADREAFAVEWQYRQ